MSKDSVKVKRFLKKRRKIRVRGKIFGTAKRPRLSVFKSLNYVYLQIIDDQKGEVLVAFHDSQIKDNNKTKTERAYEAGKELAKRALEKGISQVVFDRGGNKYHGRIKAVAQGAREGGLNF